MSGVFIPLGGGNEIGASCYYIEVDNNKILFDCGIRIKGESLYPDYNFLIRERLECLSQLDQVILSHAHYDHIGSLPYIATKTNQSTVFLSTATSKDITNLQLVELGKQNNKHRNKKIQDLQRLQAEAAINRIRSVPLIRKQEFKNCDITLYPAGHMAGACMSYVETKNHKILYTGDFTTKTTSGINEFRLDQSVLPDILIINATYGYRLNQNVNYDYVNLLNKIKTNLSLERNILLNVSNIAKCLELFYLLNSQKIPDDICVFLSPEVQKIADAYEQCGYKVYSNIIKGNVPNRANPHIFISQYPLYNEYAVINADIYSLHADYDSIKQLITTLQPRITYVVHTYPQQHGSNIVNDLTYSRSIDGSIIQTENCKLYNF